MLQFLFKVGQTTFESSKKRFFLSADTRTWPPHNTVHLSENNDYLKITLNTFVHRTQWYHTKHLSH